MCMIYMHVPALFGDLKPYHYFRAKEKVLKITSVVNLFQHFLEIVFIYTIEISVFRKFGIVCVI